MICRPGWNLGNHKCHLAWRFLVSDPFYTERWRAPTLHSPWVFALIMRSFRKCLSFPAGRILQPVQILSFLEAPFFPEPRLLANPLLSGNRWIVHIYKQWDKATWPPLKVFFPCLVPAATRWFWDNAMSFLQQTTVPSHSADPLWLSRECSFLASPFLSSLPLSYLQRAEGPVLVTFQG